MSVLSFSNALNLPKVDIASGERMLSDRYLNSCQTVCPMWDGRDDFGRKVCPDTYRLLVGNGCNTAIDRMDIEAVERPNYLLFSQPLCNAAGRPINMNARALAEKEQFRLRLIENVGYAGLSYTKALR